MPEIIDIIAIHGRTEEGNGVSRPFRCEGDDGRDYFVKLQNAGFECLVKEWIAGRLAVKMGLPVAEPCQVRVDPMLVEGNTEYESDLGHGIAFGSLKVEASERLSLEQIRNNQQLSLSQILLFDWWVKNSDRALTEIGGNPNLLWRVESREVMMIDHDNAFDLDFNPDDFRRFHALRRHLEAWAPNLRDEMIQWLDTGMAQLDSIWEELPEEWLLSPLGDSRCRLDKAGVHAFLGNFRENPDFWNLPQMSS